MLRGRGIWIEGAVTEDVAVSVESVIPFDVDDVDIFVVFDLIVALIVARAWWWE